ncbi:hypothetical protein BaRGS_00009097, partial [Batillaria attramentaria]
RKNQTSFPGCFRTIVLYIHVTREHGKASVRWHHVLKTDLSGHSPLSQVI